VNDVLIRPMVDGEAEPCERMTPGRERVLLTGATGYVGGRLLAALEAAGHRVRCMARRPEALAGRVHPRTEVVSADVLAPDTLSTALEGVHTAFYLIHAMGAGTGFEDRDRDAARNFAAAARGAGVRHVIYLGALGRSDDRLSSHLRSRQEVGEILRGSNAPVTELRASIVIGSGSLSFELIRALVERLPVMITPRWVSVGAQPIGIEDLMAYLEAALDDPPAESRILEIGGPDEVTYADMMREYARLRGLRRLMIPVPFITPWLSSLWLGLVTPLFARIGRKLIDSIRNPTVIHDDAARRTFPAIRPRGVSEAIARALSREDQEFGATRWSDALSAGGARRSWGGIRFGTRLVDSRTRSVAVSPEAAFAVVRRIGGTTGWYAWNRLWRLRGWIDLLVGGVGMRRGRRDPDHVAVGDVVDCWRVEALEPGRRLRLAAEMKLPGRAWLEFEVTPGDDGATIRQTAVFDPLGLSGLAYWYLIYPAHLLVFRGMIGGIARAAGRRGKTDERTDAPSPEPRP
jgi:uncharacterized protein YbjT (DUF2867 family)